MKLPKLPNLDNEERKDVEKVREDPNKTNVNEPSNKKRKPRIPKTEYDSEGNPILMIPDLNDVELKDEIDKYFGIQEEGD